METKKRKYQYLKVIQANCGYGWDDYTAYDQNDPEQLKELREDLKCYRENERKTLFRIISRRIPSEKKFSCYF